MWGAADQEGRGGGEQEATGLQPPSEMSSTPPALSCYMTQKVRLIFWNTEWQAVKSKNDTSKLGSAGIPSDVQTAHLIYTIHLTGGGLEVYL